MSRSNINNLTNEQISGYLILIPPKKLLDKYEKVVGSFHRTIANNVEESRQLSDLRDWLLPMLMSGQVKVTP